MATSEPPSSDRFGSEERITANLRFRSLPAAQRTLLGVLALVPPKWRGPLVAFVCAVLGALAARAVPSLVEWVRSKP